MEKETRTLKAKFKREVWDCESSLYDSFELKSFQRHLDSAISTRTMSMPHLSSSSSSVLRQPPPSDNKPASKKQSRLARSFNKFIRAVFRLRHNHSSSRDAAFYVYDTSGALSTIPELPETVPEFDKLSPDMKSLVTRARSDRFMPTSLEVLVKRKSLQWAKLTKKANKISIDFQSQLWRSRLFIVWVVEASAYLRVAMRWRFYQSLDFEDADLSKYELWTDLPTYLKKTVKC